MHQLGDEQEQFSSTGGTPSMVLAANWIVKLEAMAALCKSGDQTCPVVVNFKQFSKERKNQKVFFSDSFYTHDKGYKMCLHVDPSNITVFLQLMKGPHDDELTWPLKGKFEVKLFNQISDCEHHSVIYDDCNPAGRVTVVDTMVSGLEIRNFISKEDLHKVTPTCQYLKDNCVFFQINKL